MGDWVLESVHITELKALSLEAQKPEVYKWHLNNQ